MWNNRNVQGPLVTPPGQKIDNTTFAKLQVLETPQVPKVDAGDKKTTESRKDVAQAMNSEMLLCEIGPFLDEYGPSPGVSSTDVSACKDYLRGVDLLWKGGWKVFPVPPSKTELSEDKAFAPLEQVVQAIWKFAERQKKKKNKYEFKMVPHNHLDDSIGGGDHRMDACVLEETYKDKIPNNIIMMPFEMKIKWNKPNQIQVREQVVGDCHHILCEDPRRMFIFGATMEDYLFSLWYFSRSHSVKAFAFNWMDDEGIDMFIRVMLSFAYASSKDLGLDPHVYKANRLNADDTQQYVYEFEVPKGSVNTIPAPIGLNTRSTSSPKPVDDMVKIYYRTVTGRVPMRPLCISGRTTRIWEVVQVGSINDLPKEDAQHVILKDVWLDKESSTEGENQHRIFEAVDEFVANGLKAHSGPDGMIRFIDNDPRFKYFNERTKKRLAGHLVDGKYKELFLTKILEWKGEETKARYPGTHRPHRPLFELASVKGRGGESNRSSAAGPSVGVVTHTKATSIVSQPEEILTRRLYAQKQQVRIIYDEVCTDIYKVPNLGDVMDVCRQALDALEILYCAGWVHRDVSTGNIMALPVTSAGKTGWKVKLSDLEFAQKLGNSNHKTDPRTGTPFFMPVEIMGREYLALQLSATQTMRSGKKIRTFVNPNNLAKKFQLPSDHPDYKHYAEFRHDALPGLTALPILANHEPLAADYVGHNYQHDLESLWWVILYFMTAGVGCEDSEAYAKRIFRRNMDVEPRENTLMKSLIRKLTGCLADELATFIPPMERLREGMYEEYVKRVILKEMNTHGSYSFIHAEFAEQLDIIVDGNEDNWKELPVQVMVDNPDVNAASSPFGSTKHSRSDEDVDEGPITRSFSKRVRLG